MATHSSILAWRIPWREDPGVLQSMGSQRVGHDWVYTHTLYILRGQKKGLTGKSNLEGINRKSEWMAVPQGKSLLKGRRKNSKLLVMGWIMSLKKLVCVLTPSIGEWHPYLEIESLQTCKLRILKWDHAGFMMGLKFNDLCSSKRKEGKIWHTVSGKEVTGAWRQTLELCIYKSRNAKDCWSL